MPLCHHGGVRPTAMPTGWPCGIPGTVLPTGADTACDGECERSRVGVASANPEQGGPGTGPCAPRVRRKTGDHACPGPSSLRARPGPSSLRARPGPSSLRPPVLLLTRVPIPMGRQALAHQHAGHSCPCPGQWGSGALPPDPTLPGRPDGPLHPVTCSCWVHRGLSPRHQEPGRGSRCLRIS